MACTSVKITRESKEGEMILNDPGIMIKTVWHEIPEYYHKFNVYECVVMPNHVHGIIQIISNPKPVPRCLPCLLRLPYHPICCHRHAYPVCTHPINELQQTNVPTTTWQSPTTYLQPTIRQPRRGVPLQRYAGHKPFHLIADDHFRTAADFCRNPRSLGAEI